MSIFSFQKISLQILILSFAVLVFPVITRAQNPITWNLDSEAKGKALKSGEAFKAKLIANLEEGWHLYALDQPEGGPIATKITLADVSKFNLEGKIDAPKPTTKLDPNFPVNDKPLETKFYEKKVEFG